MDDKYEERKAALGGNKVVTKPIARIDRDVLPTRRRRANIKMTPKKMLGNVNKYFAWCERNDEVPSITGMMIFMKLYQESFYYYIKDERYRDILEQARLAIKNWVESDIYTTKGLASGKVAYAKSVLGWRESTENITTHINIDMTPQQAEAKIAALAPKLLEVLKNQHLLDQLVQPAIDVTPKEEKDG